MNTWKRRFGAIVLGTVLIFFVGEVALRLLSVVKKPAGTSASRISEAESSENVIRIVTLGESTTAPYIAPRSRGDVSWPSKLEARLNAELSGRNSTMRTRVENFARSGVSSVFQVDELRRRIQEVPVDVVITMLGINDTWPMIPEEALWYRSSYLLRWLFWAFELKDCPSCFGSVNDDFVPSRRLDLKERRAFSEYVKLLGSEHITSPERLQYVMGEFDKLESVLGADVIFPAVLETGWILFDNAEKIDSQESPEFRRSVYQAADTLLARFRPQVLRSTNALSLSCYLAMNLSKSCLPQIESAFESGLVPDDSLLSLVANMGDEVQPRELTSILKSRGFKLNTKMKSLEGVRINYRAIGEMARTHRLLWFAMQYPSGTIAGLQWVMAQSLPEKLERFENAFYLERGPLQDGVALDSVFSDVVFVSNRNFVEKTKAEGMNKYYRDLFARNAGLEFGHTTEAGYDLIVENLMKEILPRLSEIEARAAKRGSYQAKESPKDP